LVVVFPSQNHQPLSGALGKKTEEKLLLSKGIVINWLNSTEYIAFDPRSNINEISILETIEYWPESKNYIRYTPTVNLNKKGSQLFIQIEYLQTDNPDLPADDTDWGKSEIVIDLSTLKAKATWSSYGSPDGNGPGKVKVSCEEARGDRTTTLSKRVVRQQGPFRLALLCIDKKCAITGETMPEVLEAAHIKPSSDGGRETIDNGILLRSDIHKLFDSQCFSIATNGSLILTDRLSEEYQSILAGRTIEKRVIDRIYTSLEQR